MKLTILIENKPPKRSELPSEEMACGSPEEQVREAIEKIDSGHDSYIEWKLINKLYSELRSNKSARAKNLIEMIEPVLQKYGLHGVAEEK